MDIVERLRTEPEVLTPAQYWEAQGRMWHQNYKEAINEIERLREQAHYHYENGLKKDVEIESLREALQTIRDGSRDVEKSYADLQQEESE